MFSDALFSRDNSFLNHWDLANVYPLISIPSDVTEHTKYKLA